MEDPWGGQISGENRKQKKSQFGGIPLAITNNEVQMGTGILAAAVVAEVRAAAVPALPAAVVAELRAAVVAEVRAVAAARALPALAVVAEVQASAAIAPALPAATAAIPVAVRAAAVQAVDAEAVAAIGTKDPPAEAKKPNKRNQPAKILQTS